MKVKIILFNALCASVMQAQAAVTTINLTNLGPVSFASNVGTISGPTQSGEGTVNATYSYTITGLDLTGDLTANDSITFELDLTAGGTPDAIVTSHGTASYNTWGTDLPGGNAEIDGGDFIAFAPSTSTITLGDGGFNSSVVFNGFTALEHFHNNGDAGTIIVAGDPDIALAPSFGGAVTQAFGPVGSFTLDNSGGADGVKIGRLDMSYTVTTTVIPEPSSSALLGLGGLALILRRRK